MSYNIFESLIAERGLSVYKVAKATGISNTTFSDWKRGRSMPKLDKLCRIAEYLELPLETLIGSGAGGYEPPRVPVIGEIRAGAPIITNQTLLGSESADVDDAEDYFYLKVVGDSMKDIGMVEGSLVLFHKQQYAESGQIVACLVGGESATVKRFVQRGRTLYLMPENEAYAPIELTSSDFESGEARILGVAREIKIKLC